MLRRVCFRVHCRRRSDLAVLLTLALMAGAVLGGPLLSDRRADASPAGKLQQLSMSPRRYYLTKAAVNADQVLNACAPGYHMASLWEIIDAANLQYDTALGATYSDAGSGPPSYYWGWVRTGYLSSAASTPGLGNCRVWTSTDSDYYGTRVRLPPNWTGVAGHSAPWEAQTIKCSNTGTRVWCVGGYSTNYLPNVVKSY